jgi:hypothetical protein
MKSSLTILFEFELAFVSNRKVVICIQLPTSVALLTERFKKVVISKNGKTLKSFNRIQIMHSINKATLFDYFFTLF